MDKEKKRPAAATAGRTRVENSFIVSQAATACKRYLCLMGCLLAALATLLFFCAPFEPGDVSLSAGWALAAVAAWLCRELYRMADNVERREANG